MSKTPPNEQATLEIEVNIKETYYGGQKQLWFSARHLTLVGGLYPGVFVKVRDYQKKWTKSNPSCEADENGEYYKGITFGVGSKGIEEKNFDVFVRDGTVFRIKMPSTGSLVVVKNFKDGDEKQPTVTRWVKKK